MQDERTKKAFFIVEPSGVQLAEISRLLEVGDLRCFVSAEVPFASASQAYGLAPAERRTPGKVVITISE